MHAQLLNWVFPFSVNDSLQPAWHDEKYVIPSEPHTGENLFLSQSQNALQDELVPNELRKKKHEHEKDHDKFAGIYFPLSIALITVLTYRIEQCYQS